MTRNASMSFEAAKVGSRVPLGPNAPEWKGAGEVVLELAPTPIESQPSAYVQQAWAGRPRGDAGSVSVRALASRDRLSLRLEWVATDPVNRISDNGVYADSCAVMFPRSSSADIATMGDPSEPVTAVQWLAGKERPYVVRAQGLGTAKREADHGAEAIGDWSGGSWKVVLSCPLGGGTPDLSPGSSTSIGVAIWSGAAGERAGVKAHTPVWHTLKIG